jgi:hypothetical protein
VADGAAHLEQARSNRAFAERLLQEHGAEPIDRQWAMTAAFYAALHCMEAALSAAASPHRTHVERRAALAEPANNIAGNVYFAYDQLRQWSEAARYDMRSFSKVQVRRALDDY